MGKRTETQLEKLKLGGQGWNEILSANAEKLNDILLRIDGLLDVDIADLKTGDVLWWNASNQKFENINKAYAISAGSVSSWSSESSVSSVSSNSSESSDSSESSETISSSSSSWSSEESSSSSSSESSYSSLSSYSSSSSSSSESSAQGTLLTAEITANGDDGHGRQDESNFSASDAYTVFGNLGGNEWRSFFRFQNVTIPEDSTIYEAYLRVRGNGPYTTQTCNLNITIEDVDDSTAIVSGADLVSRSLGSPVAWNSVPSFSSGVWVNSPSLVSILQTQINKTGWDTGQALTIHLRDNSSSSGAHRYASARDQNTTYSAELVIRYTAP